MENLRSKYLSSYHIYESNFFMACNIIHNWTWFHIQMRLRSPLEEARKSRSFIWGGHDEANHRQHDTSSSVNRFLGRELSEWVLVSRRNCKRTGKCDFIQHKIYHWFLSALVLNPKLVVFTFYIGIFLFQPGCLCPSAKSTGSSALNSLSWSRLSWHSLAKELINQDP